MDLSSSIAFCNFENFNLFKIPKVTLKSGRFKYHIGNPHYRAYLKNNMEKNYQRL